MLTHRLTEDSWDLSNLLAREDEYPFGFPLTTLIQRPTESRTKTVNFGGFPNVRDKGATLTLAGATATAAYAPGFSAGTLPTLTLVSRPAGFPGGPRVYFTCAGGTDTFDYFLTVTVPCSDGSTLERVVPFSVRTVPYAAPLRQEPSDLRTKILDFGFSPQLRDYGETLSAVTGLTVATAPGFSGALPTLGAATISGRRVLFTLTGGIDANDYWITGTVTTSLGDTLVEVVPVSVRLNPP